MAEETCIAGICVGKAPLPAAWSAEILPPINDMVHAITEIASINSTSPTLETEPLAPLSATFAFVTLQPVPDNANVTLTVPPAIPGRPDRTFETRAVLDPQKRSLVATMSTPANVTYRGGGVIRLVPIPPNDDTSPPRSFNVGGASSFAFSIDATDVPLRGRLLDAMGMPIPPGFVARALQDGVVSNVAPVDSRTGAFTIAIPVSTTIRPVQVQFVPQGSDDGHPSFLSSERVLSPNGTYPNLDVIMPTYISVPNAFSLTIAGDAEGEPPISGALVRAVSTLSGPDGQACTDTGSCRFVRDDITDDQGLAVLSLLPGTAAQLRDYEVAVVPPASSKFQTLCRRISILAGGNGGSPPANVQLEPRLVPRRRVFSGRVLDGKGAPVGDVVIAATPGPAPAKGCAVTHPASATVVTESATGQFKLPLDPGTYQIDYDPPGGSAVPRLTELDITMTATADIERDVRLPEARVVEGVVNGADRKTPLANATVRLYEVRCSGASCTGPDRLAPWLRGVARTDSNGRFRAVVARDASD
jgi:hypothetical protein